MTATKMFLLFITLITISGCGDFEWFPSGTRPKPFSFAGKTGVDLGAPVESGAITISGNLRPAEVSISNGSYAIESGSYTSAPGKISDGQKITILQIAANTADTPTVTTLTIGGVSATFTSTTRTAAPVFSNSSTVTQPVFTTQTNVAPSSTVVSEPVTITGNTSPSPISVSNGEYSFDGTTFVTADGLVNAGQQVTLRHTAASTPKTATKTTLTLRNVTATFYSFTNGGTSTFSNYSTPTPLTTAGNVDVVSITTTEKGRANGTVTFNLNYALNNKNPVAKTVRLAIAGVDAQGKKIVPGYYYPEPAAIGPNQPFAGTISQLSISATLYDNVKNWVARSLTVQ